MVPNLFLSWVQWASKRLIYKRKITRLQNLCKYQLSKGTSWSSQFSKNGWKIGRKVIGLKDASVKRTRLKMLRTVLLNTLCRIVTKIFAKCWNKRNKHAHAHKTCFFLRFLRRAGSPLLDVWLFCHLLILSFIVIACGRVFFT